MKVKSIGNQNQEPTIIMNENISSQIIRPKSILIVMGIAAFYILSCYIMH